MSLNARVTAVAVLTLFTITAYVLLRLLFSPQTVLTPAQPTAISQNTTDPTSAASVSGSRIDSEPGGGIDVSGDPFIDEPSTDPQLEDLPPTPQTAPPVVLLQGLPIEGVPTASVDQGSQPLEYTLQDGYKVFNLTAQPVAWEILDGVQVTAWAYNGMIPGPLIRVTEGDNVRVNLTNALPEPTTIHWQARDIPLDQQGIPEMTQSPIEPGDTFTYEFTASAAGSYSYYSFTNRTVQVALGLFGAFIVDPAEPDEPAPAVDIPIMLSEWRVTGSLTFPAASVGGAEPNYYTINGKSYPDTAPINVQVGDRVRLRIYGMSAFSHPLHLQGASFTVVGIDGIALAENRRYITDTVVIHQGGQIDIEFTPTQTGIMLLKCNIGLHTINNFGLEEGGLVLQMNVSERE